VARVDALVNGYFPADMPGATLIVVRDGQPLLRKAYGLADAEHQQAMTPQASLRLGSITKQFTAVAIMMLVDEGKLSLADPVTRFFPDYPAQGGKVTLEHLLTHTSGIASFTGKPSYVPNMARDYSVREMIDGFNNGPLEFEPGARYAYNNSGYFLLGAIIGKVSGLSYADYLAQRIFILLGMDQTAYEGHQRHPIVERARGYTRTVQREGGHLLVGRTGGTLNPVLAYADNAFFTPKSLTR
jgi:CubicO group peptidase (beta-lactamase class C family)